MDIIWHMHMIMSHFTVIPCVNFGSPRLYVLECTVTSLVSPAHIWAALREKVPIGLSRRHTKRRAGAALRALLLV